MRSRSLLEDPCECTIASEMYATHCKTLFPTLASITSKKGVYLQRLPLNFWESIANRSDLNWISCDFLRFEISRITVWISRITVWIRRITFRQNAVCVGLFSHGDVKFLTVGWQKHARKHWWPKGHLYHLLGVSDYCVMYRHRAQSVLWNVCKDHWLGNWSLLMVL